VNDAEMQFPVTHQILFVLQSIQGPLTAQEKRNVRQEEAKILRQI
jgi:hypothetical protein